MEEEFNLSEKEQEILLSENIYFRGYPTKYVKEFIKEIEDKCDLGLLQKKALWKLAGDKLW